MTTKPVDPETVNPDHVRTVFVDDMCFNDHCGGNCKTCDDARYNDCEAIQNARLALIALVQEKYQFAQVDFTPADRIQSEIAAGHVRKPFLYSWDDPEYDEWLDKMW